MYLEGIIQEDGYTILGEDDKEYRLPFRMTGDDGFPEVLINAKDVGGDGYMARQSVRAYIGYTVSFFTKNQNDDGMNYKILPKEV